jgi:hypothetical protein
MIWKANKENVDYKIITTENKNGLLLHTEAKKQHLLPSS